MVCFRVMAIAAVLFLICFWGRYGEVQNRFEVEYTIEMNGERSQEGPVKTLSVELPDDFADGQYILFKTTHTKVEVAVGNEVIYRYGWEENSPDFLKSPGTYWHVVSVPGNSDQKTLMLQLHSVYDDYFGDEIVLKYGSRGDCVLELVLGSSGFLVINSIIIFAGLLSFLMHFVTKGRSRDEVGNFLCVGYLAFLIAIWSLCQSGFLQFIIPNGRILYFVDLFSFFLFPVPFNLFVYNICGKKYRKGFTVLTALYLINMAVEIIIQLTGWKDIFEMISFTHAMMAVNVVYVFWAIHSEIKAYGNATARKFRVPLYIVMLFAAAELVTYYVNDLTKTSFFLPIGTIVFISMLIWIQVNQYYQSMMEEEKLLYFEKLANTDMLTEAMNRNAYENMLKALEKQEHQMLAANVVMFDVNDMKYINDNFGHEKGDEALRLCYRCICEVFGKMGKCYRIGGDEFVVLSGMNYELEHAVERFERLIDTKKENLDFPFSIAVGYARYDPQKDENFRNTIRRSDEMMYLDKKRKKKH